MTSPSSQGLSPPVAAVVLVVLAPTTTGLPPPLVSFVAVQAGAFAQGAEKVSVQTVPAAWPRVTLPAASVPTMLAPAPQLAPSVGGTANEVPVQTSSTAPASGTVSMTLVLRASRRMIAAPSFMPFLEP